MAPDASGLEPGDVLSSDTDATDGDVTEDETTAAESEEPTENTESAEDTEKWNCEVCGAYFDEHYNARTHLVNRHRFTERVAALLRRGPPTDADG